MLQSGYLSCDFSQGAMNKHPITPENPVTSNQRNASTHVYLVQEGVHQLYKRFITVLLHIFSVTWATSHLKGMGLLVGTCNPMYLNTLRKVIFKEWNRLEVIGIFFHVSPFFENNFFLIKYILYTVFPIPSAHLSHLNKLLLCLSWE